MIRRWLLDHCSGDKSLRAWWQISQSTCDDGYVRGVKQTCAADKDKLRLPSKDERKANVRRIA